MGGFRRETEVSWLEGWCRHLRVKGHGVRTFCPLFPVLLPPLGSMMAVTALLESESSEPNAALVKATQTLPQAGVLMSE